MRKYLLSITTPGRMIALKKRRVRTPTECIIDESEIKIIESRLNSAGIVGYSINPFNEKTKKPEPKVDIIEQELTFEEVKPKKEALSTLDKIMNEV